MAIFASTTTSGYSDPLKAMSIKALEQRQKDMLAQQAQQQPDAAMMGTIPGGIGHVLGQIGDRMQQGRTDQALMAQKQELARIMSGYDVAGDAPPPAAVASLAPDLYKDMMQTWSENRRARASITAAAEQARLGREHTSTESGLTRAQQKELQTQSQAHTSAESGLTRAQQAELAASADRRARELQTEQLTHTDARADKTDTRIVSEGEKGRVQQAELQKERLAAEAAIEDKKTAAAAATRAADPKRLEAVRSSETDYRKGLSHIENLEEAAKILEHPKGVYTGAMQNVAPAASGVPGVSMFVDKEKAQNTSRFNTIVGEDAIRDMSETLKGSSTNYEMNEFKKMKNDPNISDAQRSAQLRKVVKAAKADLESQAKETQAIGGDTARIDKAMRGGGDAPADPLEGKTITNKATGEQMIRRSGKWEPISGK